MSREFRLSIDAVPRPRGASPELNQVWQWLTNNPFGGSPAASLGGQSFSFRVKASLFPRKELALGDLPGGTDPAGQRVGAVGARGARPAAPHRARLDAGHARAGPVLEGVHQPDRARPRATDAAALDWLADRLGRRPAVPRDRRLSRGESGLPAWSRARRRRSRARVTTRRSSASTGRPAVAGLEPDLAAARAARRGDGAHRARRVEDGARASRAGARPRRGRSFTEVDRANVSSTSGRCRYKLSSIPTAVALFTEALELMRRPSRVDDRLALEDPPLAVALLPAPERHGGGARGRRGGARAGRAARRP